LGEKGVKPVTFFDWVYECSLERALRELAH